MQHITAKLGNMRKATDWVVYPAQPMNPHILVIQSDHRIAHIDSQTGEGMLSAHKSGGAYFVHLVKEAGASYITAPKDVIEAALAARPQSGDNVGAGVRVA